jgi:ABC-type antimicrobial peptide transport system permease subunit
MFRNYLLTAIRNFRKNKIFSFINIAGLTLGLGCSLALFMVVRYERSYDSYHAGHARTYRIVSDFRYPEGTEYQDGVPYPLPEAFKHEFPEARVAVINAAYNNQITIGRDGQGTRRFKEEQGIFYTEPALFGIFDFKWLHGDATLLHQPNVIALSRELAEKYFGDWKNAIGRTLLKDNKELLTVQGIYEDPPSNTDIPLKAAISFATMAQSVKSRGWGTVSGRHQCYVLLPPHLSIGQVNSRMPAFHRKYVHNKTDFYSLQPLSDVHFNERYGTFTGKTVRKDTLWTLSLIAGFLLVLGCINFVNLSTAQAIGRRKEVGIRKVLGSRRWQLMIQFLGETALLVVASMALAIGILTLLSPHSSGVLNSAALLKPLQSRETLLWAAAIVVLVTLLSGFYPALLASGRHPLDALKDKMTMGRTGGLSLRRVLVTGQMVIAQALITGVLVAISQVNFFLNAPMGFDQHAITTVSLPADSVSRTKWESFRHQLLQSPGVEKVSLSSAPPAGKGNSFATFRLDQNVKDENFEVNIKVADADYFSTYGIQLIAGRSYQPSDTIREFVVNETFLKKKAIRTPEEALGKLIYMDDKKGAIVGVVRDFHEHSLRDPIDPLVITTDKSSYRMAGVKLSTTGMPATIARLEKIFNSYFPDNFFEHRFLDETIARYYEQERRLSTLFTLFAAIALTISCLGLYGLILFTTSQRLKEVGIRKVLGASTARISLLFIREFCWLTGIAFLIASPLAWYFMQQWLENFTYRIHISPWMFMISGVGTFLTGLLTVSIRTVRTAMANPVKSLRAE